MHFKEKIKCWFDQNKKYVLIGGSIALIVVGTSVSYVLCKDKRVSFSNWLKNAPKEELEKAYKKLRLDFCKTGDKSGLEYSDQYTAFGEQKLGAGFLSCLYEGRQD